MALTRAWALPVLVLLLWGAGRSAWAAPLSASDHRTYVAAFAAAKRGDWAKAETLAASAHDRLPAEALTFFDDLRNGTTASFSAIAAFIHAHPDWPELMVLRERAEAAIATATDAQLVPFFREYPPLTPAAKLRFAQIQTQAGHRTEAKRLIRQAWIDGDYTAAKEKMMLHRYRGVLRGVDNARRLDRLIWDGQYAEAKHMLRHVGRATAALDHARIGLATMAPGVEALIARVPRRLRHNPGLMFERLRWRRRKNLDEGAAAILEHPPARLVRPEAWASERLIIVRRLLDDHQIWLAYRLAAAANGLSGGLDFAELQFLAGWIALRELHRPGVAYDHFVHLYHAVKFPISRARGAYWSGRAAAAMGKPSLARTWYETAAPFITTYYGQLAAARLGITISAFDIREPDPTPAETRAFDRNEFVRLARDLAQIGVSDDLAVFLRRIANEAKTSADYVLTAHLARALGRPDIAVYAAQRASHAGITLVDEGYPIADLPPGVSREKPLVLAMTRQESAFDASAVSNAGALGLMQLMPATASKVARHLHMRFSRRRLTSDVAYNMKLGRAYLASLVSDFSGSYVLAIAAYNAGPARVRQWIEEYGDPRSAKVDPIDWIERIPYTETRNYVQRVLENLQVYRFRLGTAEPTLSLAADLRR